MKRQKTFLELLNGKPEVTSKKLTLFVTDCSLIKLDELGPGIGNSLEKKLPHFSGSACSMVSLAKQPSTLKNVRAQRTPRPSKGPTKADFTFEEDAYFI